MSLSTFIHCQGRNKIAERMNPSALAMEFVSAQVALQRGATTAAGGWSARRS
jgi:hypothetical protein